MFRLSIVLSGVLLALAVGCKKNHAPDVPSVPSGPASAALNAPCTFSSRADDADGDSVAVRFDWADGDTSDWSPYEASGEPVTASHSWSTSGTYGVRSQARDAEGMLSSWSSGHAVRAARGWKRTLGGSGSDLAKSVQQTSDGGYIITGFTDCRGAGGLDIWLIKTDVNGDTEWTRTYGGPGDDLGYSVLQASDGAYLVAGVLGSDACIIRTEPDGDSAWVRTFGGTAWDGGRCLQQTRDGGYVIAGSTLSYGAGESDAWLVKTDVAGSVVWSKTFGGPQGDQGYSVRQTQDGGYILTGSTWAGTGLGYYVWLIKTDAAGTVVWDKLYGGVGLNRRGECVLQATDGGYVVVGCTEFAFIGAGDIWLIKTDAAGDTVWTRTFGGTGFEMGHSVQQTADGGYIVTGFNGSSGAGSYEIWLIKTDGSGNEVWDRLIGGTSDDDGACVHQTTDGGYILTGCTDFMGSGYSDIWLIKTDAEGRLDEVGGD